MTKYRWLITTTVLTCGLFGVGLMPVAAQQVTASPASGIVDRFQRT
jgi:hypothetical protein